MRPFSMQLLLTVFIFAMLAIPISGCRTTRSMSKEVEVYVHEPTDSYTEMSMYGFTVLVSSAALEHPESTNPALELLEKKLGQVIEFTPTHTHEALQSVRIWLEHQNPDFPCACYHPSQEWLSEHGYNTDKTDGIEITNAEHFVEWTLRDQPLMVLHELAHAYHDRVLGYARPEILKAFEHAQEMGKYESVGHITGQTRRHYGLNNEQEYFAELTESYFGKNDFEPFTRDELAEFDPHGLAMIENMWGVSAKIKDQSE